MGGVFLLLLLGGAALLAMGDPKKKSTGIANAGETWRQTYLFSSPELTEQAAVGGQFFAGIEEGGMAKVVGARSPDPSRLTIDVQYLEGSNIPVEPGAKLGTAEAWMQLESAERIA